MNSLQAPETLKLPFANNGQKNDIPLVAEGANSNKATLTDGFPPITMKPKDDGGLPPEGKDFNGILYLATSFYFAFQNGWLPTFEQSVSDAIGGYAKGAILWYTAGESRQALQSTKNDNTDNFNTDPSVIGTSWVPVFPDLQTILENMPIGLHVGDLLPNMGKEPPAGRMLANGQIIQNCQTLYPEFYTYVVEKTNYKTFSEWQAEANEYGQCGYCGVQGADIRLPLITRPISGVNDVAQAGMAIHDTMRPLTGEFAGFDRGDRGSYSGMFKVERRWSANVESGGSDNWGTIVKADSAELGKNFSGGETRGKQILYPYSVVVYTTIPDKATVDVGELVALVKQQNQVGIEELPAESGTIQLQAGGIYKGILTGNTTFVLPQITDTSLFAQITVQLQIANEIDVDFGTDLYLGAAPSGSAGNYNVFYEYDSIEQKWAVGSLSKVGG